MSQKSSHPDITPFPSSDSGPTAFREENENRLPSRENEYRGALQMAVQRVLKAIASGNLLDDAVITSKIATNALAVTGVAMGHALSLDEDTNDYVSIKGFSYSSTQSAATVEAWVRTSDGKGTIASYHRDAYFQFTQGAGSGAADGNPVVRIWTGGSRLDLVGTAIINDGEDHHLAFTFDGGAQEVRLYVDGSLDSTWGSADGVGSTFGDGSTRFGALGTESEMTTEDGTVLHGSHDWTGRIDEFRLWSTVRSASEIADNRNKKIQPGTNGLEVYYGFDDPGRDEVFDETGQGRDGILKNSAKRAFGSGSTGATFTKSMRFTAADFRPVDTDVHPNKINSFGALEANSTGEMLAVAALILPVGVTIKRIRTHGYSEDAGDVVETDLVRAEQNGTLPTTIATYALTEGGGWQTVSSGALSEKVAASHYYIVIDMEPDDQVTDAQMLWVEVDYEVSDLEQSL